MRSSSPLDAMRGWLSDLEALTSASFPSAEDLIRRKTPLNRATRVLRAADGWWALTLSRQADRELVPALASSGLSTSELEGEALWKHVAAWSRSVLADEALGRAILLGLAAAVLPTGDSAHPAEPSIAAGSSRDESPQVIDLSALWAGPLAAALLAMGGASVTKVESTERPDSMREGDPELFARVNANKEQLTLPLRTTEGRDLLLQLIARADIVIESSRPRALEQLGVRTHEILASQPDLLWVSITAYGRADAPQRIGFGDDIAFGAGLVEWPGDADTPPLIVGDALPDPLTGVYAARAAQSAWLDHQGGLIDISMHQVARAAA